MKLSSTQRYSFFYKHNNNDITKLYIVGYRVQQNDSNMTLKKCRVLYKEKTLD